MVVRCICWVGVCFLTAMFCCTISAQPESSYIWVASDRGAHQFSTATGTRQDVVQSPQGFSSVAWDAPRELVWLYRDGHVTAHDLGGAQILEFAVPELVAPAQSLPAPTGWQVAPDGSLWLAVGERLLHLGDDGQLFREIHLEAPILELALDTTNEQVWAVTAKRVSAFAMGNGSETRTLSVPRRATVRDLEFDPASEQVWLARSDGLFSYDTTGSELLSAPSEGVDRVALDGSFGLWLTSGRELLRIDASGDIALRIKPFSDPLPIRRLLIDPANRTAWVVAGNGLAVVDAGGRSKVLRQADARRVIHDLALQPGTPDLTPPTLEIVSPSEGSKTRRRPRFVVRFDDEGAGVDASSLVFRIDETEITTECRTRRRFAACRPTSRLEPGELVLEATVTDYAGNVSDPVTVGFEISSVRELASSDDPTRGTASSDDLTDTPIASTRGLVPDNPFLAGGGIESINLASGNVMQRIPLGQSYSVGPMLSYQLMAVHNSDAWDHVRLRCEHNGCPAQVDMTFSMPQRGANAGLGWEVHLGRLYAPTPPTGLHVWDQQSWPNRSIESGAGQFERWLYVAPDGAQHYLEKIDGGFFSTDGSRLRLRTISANQKWVEMPNGVYSVFTKTDSFLGTRFCGTGGTGCWRLSAIRDPYGNEMTVTYVSGGTDRENWEIRDSVGRYHVIKFKTDDSATAGGDAQGAQLTNGSDQLGDLRRVVDEVGVATFGGVISTYKFEYLSGNRTLSRGCPHDIYTARPADANITVPILSKITLPDQGHDAVQDYSFATGVSTTGCSVSNGRLTKIGFPSQGSVDYTYEYWPFATQCVFEPDPDAEATYSRAGIGTKRLRSLDTDGTWTYSSVLEAEGNPILDGANCRRATTRKTTVNAPAVGGKYTRVVSYNSISQGPRTPSSSTSINTVDRAADNGLPFSKSDREGSGAAARFLSEEVFECTTGSICEAITSRYLRYETGYRQCQKNFGDSPDCFKLHPRMAVERTVYHRDGNRFVERRMSGWDGASHARTETVVDTFPGTERELAETSTNYTVTGLDGSGLPRTLPVNSSTGYISLGSPSSYLPGPTSPWILTPYNTVTRKEGNLEYKTEYEFNSQGSMTCMRQWKSSGARTSQDLVTKMVRNGDGLVTSETVAGGEGGTLSTGQMCSTTGVESQGTRHVTTHTYQHRTLASSKTANLPFSYEADIDKNTGLPKWTANPAGQKTYFTYDRLGRVKRMDPESSLGEADTSLTYVNSVGADPQVIIRRLTNSGDEVLEDTLIYDTLGRLTREITEQPVSPGNSNPLSERETVYDDAGRVIKVTTVQSAGNVSQQNATRYESYDALGRPRRITLPDGFVEQREYDGASEMRSIVSVRTSTGLLSVTTTTLYDGLGRAERVTNPLFSTTSTYDPNGEVLSVMRSAGGFSQKREYAYDNRGFMTSETHPEIGYLTPSTQVATYTPDAFGNPRRIKDGLHTLDYEYDIGGRLTRVKEGPLVIETRAYGTANNGTDKRLGKLIEVVRYNYPSTGEPQAIAETYEYRGKLGKLSRQTTQLRYPNRTGDDHHGVTFEQSWEYDLLGNVTKTHYPQCITTPQNGREFCVNSELFRDGFESGDTSAWSDLTRTSVGTLPVAPDHTATSTFYRGKPVSVSSTHGISAVYTYHPNLQFSGVTYSNGTTVEHSQDPDGMGRPRRILHKQGSNELFDSGLYDYDGTGRITTIGSDDYRYDKAGRLVSGTVKEAGANVRADFTYDTAGNIVSRAVNGGAAASYTYDVKNRLTSSPVNVDHGYDGAGNHIRIGPSSAPIYQMQYDALNMMSRMQDDSNPAAQIDETYIYGPGNRRIVVENNLTGERTWTLRDQTGQILREFTVNGSGHYQGVFNSGEQWLFVKDYIRGLDGLVATSDYQGRQHFIHKDHLGSTRVLTDANGTVTGTHHYYPYGAAVGGNGVGDEPRARFTGHEQDSNGTVYYMMGRSYGAPLFRFLSVDPARDGWNLYAYVGGDPMNLVDPTGLAARALDDDARAAILFVAGPDASAVSFADDGTVSVDATADQLAGNAGLAFLHELVAADEMIGVAIGTHARSASGDIPLTAGKSVRNLSSTPDNRRPDGSQRLPPAGFDGMVAVLDSYTATRTERSETPRPISRDLVVFHELAENYFKTVGKQQYSAAHAGAIALERRLRAERPDLDQYAFGAGTFTNRP